MEPPPQLPVLYSSNFLFIGVPSYVVYFVQAVQPELHINNAEFMKCPSSVFPF